MAACELYLIIGMKSPSPCPEIRARRSEVLKVPYSQRMHIQVKKDKLLRKDSKCLHMYFKPSMKNNPFQKKKNRYKSGFSVCFPEKQYQCSIVSKGETSIRHGAAPPPNPSVLQLSHFLIHLLFFFLFHYTQGRIKVTKT